LTYSPLPDGLGPKLLPTVPVHVQVFPALLVHCAVAVAPTVRQLTARFSRISGVGEAVITPARARDSAAEKSIVTNDVRER
jgi:hypothetical protein